MSVRLRNVVANLDDPVSDWPFEAVLTVVERGGLSDWARLATEIEQHPWGEVARKVEQAVQVSVSYATGELLTVVVKESRAQRDHEYRARVIKMIMSAIEESGMTASEFAANVGTSGSRLSTYVSGKAVPSAALLLRMQHETR